MPRHVGRHLHRRRALAMLLALAAALLPSWSWAASCNSGYLGVAPDIGACVDATNYSGWKGLATLFWLGNRVLLASAYVIDQLRGWLIAGVFQSIAAQLQRVLGPLVAPLAGLALTIALLAIIAQPVTGKPLTGNLRQIFVLVLLVPMVLTQLGPLMAQVEETRSDLGAAITTDLSLAVPTSLFGATSSAPDMARVKALYPTRCNGHTLERSTSGLTITDAAAAAIWADATDIHCPQEAGNDHPELPAQWFVPAPGGPGYAYNGDLGDVSDAAQRSQAIRGIQAGVTRAALCLLPSALGVLDRLIQLLFTLGLVILFLSLPLTLLFSFFQESFAGIAALIQGAANLLKVSWSVSFVTNLLSLCLVAATGTHDAIAYLACASLAGIVMFVLFLLTGLALWQALGAASQSIGQATGLDVGKAAQATANVAGAAVGVGVGIATGGASVAAAGLSAAAQGASGEYAMGMAMSASKPLAQVGALANAMGLLSSETEQGLYTGSVMGRGEPLSMRAQRQVRADTARYQGTGSSAPDDAYPTAEDAAEQHQQREDRRDDARVRRETEPERERWEASKKITSLAKGQLKAAQAEQDQAVASGAPPEQQAELGLKVERLQALVEAAQGVEQESQIAHDQAVARASGGVYGEVAREVISRVEVDITGGTAAPAPGGSGPAGPPLPGGGGGSPALPGGGGPAAPALPAGSSTPVLPGPDPLLGGEPPTTPPAPAPVPATPRPSAPAGPARTEPETEER